jgi:lysozyme
MRAGTMKPSLLRVARPAALLVISLSGCVVAAPSPEETSTSSEAVTVCGMTTVQGVDISHYDGMIDWPTAKAAGISFAFAKATEGTTFVDPMFSTNWSGMKAAGVARGAYHFFHADLDPMQQATFVLQTVGQLDADDLPITLDLETTNGQSEATILANATTFLQAVTQATGKTAVLYVSPSFLSSYAGLAGYQLWIANWGVNCPDVPSPWSTYTFWQTSDSGSVNGIPSTVDLDVFNGTLSQLTGGMMADGGGSSSGSGGSSSGSGGSSSGGGNSSSGGGNSSSGGGNSSSGGGNSSSGGGNSSSSGGFGSSSSGASSGGSDDGGSNWSQASGNSSGCGVAPRGAAEDASLPLGVTAAMALLVVRRRRRK